MFSTAFQATYGDEIISVPNHSPAEVTVSSVFGWVLMEVRRGTSFNWRKPWADYKAGFGTTDSGNMWLGLV